MQKNGTLAVDAAALSAAIGDDLSAVATSCRRLRRRVQEQPPMAWSAAAD
jgi:hypothetical protein